MLLAGCRDKELSFELDLNGLRRGAMTYYLTKEVRETNKAGVTYQEIMQRVAANVTRENPASIRSSKAPAIDSCSNAPCLRNGKPKDGRLCLGLAQRGMKWFCRPADPGPDSWLDL